MASTRRQQLAEVLGEDGPGIPEANGSEAEDRFPFESLSGLGSVEEPPPVKTRVKPPEQSDKASKAEARKDTRPRGTATERQLAEIGDSLEEKIAQFAMLAHGLAPVTSVYAAENSPKAIKALLQIAKNRPKVLAFLSTAADGVNALELAKFIGGLVVAIQVDAGRLKGDEMPARAFGVTDIIDTYFTDDEDQPNNPAVQFQAPRYAPV